MRFILAASLLAGCAQMPVCPVGFPDCKTQMRNDEGNTVPDAFICP